MITNKDIELAAYFKWLALGKPENKALAIWLEAKKEYEDKQKIDKYLDEWCDSVI